MHQSQAGSGSFGAIIGVPGMTGFYMHSKRGASAVPEFPTTPAGGLRNAQMRHTESIRLLFANEGRVTVHPANKEALNERHQKLTARMNCTNTQPKTNCHRKWHIKHLKACPKPDARQRALSQACASPNSNKQSIFWCAPCVPAHGFCRV